MKRIVAKLGRTAKLLRISQTPADVPIKVTPAAPTSPVSTIGPSQKSRPQTQKPTQSEPSQQLEANNKVQSGSESCLENLTAEIRRLLLGFLDLPRPRALVSASPTFHQQYRLDRHHILCQSLDQTLGANAPIAYAVHLRRARLGSEGYPDPQGVKDVSPECKSFIGKLSQDEALDMIVFYFQTVNPVVEQFARQTLDKLAEDVAQHPRTTGPGPGSKRALTDTESRRLLRAAYRYQLFCQITGWHYSIFRGPNNDAREEAALLYLDMLPPWEIEEFYCFYLFAQSICEKSLDDIRWDVHPDNPKFDNQGRPPTPDGAFDLGNGFNTELYVEGLTLHGLPLLAMILFDMEDHEHLVTTIQPRITTSYISVDDNIGLLGERQQDDRREQRMSERDRMQDRRDPCPFVGDDANMIPESMCS